MHIADSRLALGREGFRFSGLGTIENKEEKKSQSWWRFLPLGSTRTLDPARRVHGRPCGHGGLGPPARTRRVRAGGSWPRGGGPPAVFVKRSVQADAFFRSFFLVSIVAAA